LATKAARDNSFSLDMGSIYFHEYKTPEQNGFYDQGVSERPVRKYHIHSTAKDGRKRSTEEIQARIAAFRAEIERLKTTGIKIIYQVSDALENTNGLADKKAANAATSSWSVVAAFDLYNRLSDDKFRIGGVSFNAANAAGVTPFDLPSVALPKIARAKGLYIDYFINHTVIAFLGPREVKKDYETPGEKHRHQAIIDDALALKKRYPDLRIVMPGDGDLIFREVSSTGIPLRLIAMNILW